MWDDPFGPPPGFCPAFRGGSVIANCSRNGAVQSIAEVQRDDETLAAGGGRGARRLWRFSAEATRIACSKRNSLPMRKSQQAVNRLTFGARPGDLEQVRKLGVEKWIELQLHPERIAENPVLEIRLKPLETIRIECADILKQYSPQRPGMLRSRPRSV